MNTKSMFLHIITNMVPKVMNFIGISNKTQPHHTCISYTTISTNKISYTILITKMQGYSPKANDYVLKNKNSTPLECAHEHKENPIWVPNKKLQHQNLATSCEL